MELFAKDNFNLLLTVSVAATVLAVLASVAYRTLKGKQYPSTPAQDVRFTEKWVSGASHKNLLTKIGGARNCLSVTLSSSALFVRPMFPFSLMFLPEVYDLEHFIPRSKIRRVEPGGGGAAGSVLIEFESGGREKRIELTLRKHEEFLRAVSV